MRTNQWAIEQWIHSSHLRLCCMYMVIITTLSMHFFLCSTAAQTKAVPNVALSSPHDVAIE